MDNNTVWFALNPRFSSCYLKIKIINLIMSRKCIFQYLVWFALNPRFFDKQYLKKKWNPMGKKVMQDLMEAYLRIS